MPDTPGTDHSVTVPDAQALTAARTGTDPRALVEAFIAALEALDLDAALELAHPDISYQNVPFPAAVGIAATRRTLKAMLAPVTSFEVRMLNIAAGDDIVLTERVDVISIGRFKLHVWVCGTFQARDGQVALWRDRFDFLDVTIGVVRALAGIALPSLNRG